MSFYEAMTVTKDFKEHDLHNVSYNNSRSGQGALGRRDSICLDVSETPKAFDLFPKEKGGGAECRKVLPSPSRTFMHDVPLKISARPFKEQPSKLGSSFIKLYFGFIFIVVLSRLQHFFSWGKCFFLSQSRTWRPSAGTFIKD